VNAASTAKWLETHGHAHWTHFYTDHGVRLQKRFFGHFLKREDTDGTGRRGCSSRCVSSSTGDADVFLVLRVFVPDGGEVTFHGAQDPRTPIGQGWLRASHRKLDPVRSLPYRPYHTHDELQPLTPGEPVELHVEIWPSCIVVPPGHRVGLAVRGRDYQYPGPPLDIPGVNYTLTGVGPFLHDHPEDRPRDLFGGRHTLHFAPARPPYVLLPIIPAQ
jgi:uncharacterized protein